MTIGFYPGSFDPVTFGHLDIMARAAKIFDHVVIGIGIHGGKQPLFDMATRKALVEQLVAPLAQASGKKFEVIAYDDLTTVAAKRLGASAIIRGLRDATDFDYEVQVAQMNARQEPEIETIFLAASPETRMIASSLVKQIARMGGDVSPFVPDLVQQAMVKIL